MKRIVLQIIKNALLVILILVLCLSLYSTNWAISTFNFMNFDEVLFQLTTPIASTSASILNSFLSNSLLLSIISTVLIFTVVFIILHYLSCKSFDIELTVKKKKYNFSVRGKTIKRCLGVFTFIITIGVLYYCLDKMLFIDFVKAQADDSMFIEEHYIDPNSVSITFPEQKRNLIYIYAESFESTFFSTELGGGSDNYYIAPLYDITANNVSFSDTELFGGAIPVTGTSWTSGAMVAHTSGLPLKNSLDNINGMSSMLSGATALGNIMEDNGYKQMLMIGSDKTFGNRGAYFENHGNYEVYDYYTAIKKKKIDKDYYEWWGFEDSKLFEYAKEEITNMANSGEPFNFTMLTSNTHTEDGYLESTCPKAFGYQYGNVIYCSALQLSEFIKWIQEQDFYPNTTVILVGDHVSMQEGLYPEGTPRRVYNVFINSAVQEGNFKNRKFTTLDFFPTTLASLGVEIEGNRLGLGTNLFSDQPTLMEEVGQDTMISELTKYSTFYMKNFYYS